MFLSVLITIKTIIIYVICRNYGVHKLFSLLIVLNRGNMLFRLTKQIDCLMQFYYTYNSILIILHINSYIFHDLNLKFIKVGHECTYARFAKF